MVNSVAIGREEGERGTIADRGHAGFRTRLCRYRGLPAPSGAHTFVPVDIAVELGLLVMKKIDRGGKEYTDVELDRAHSRISEHL